MMRALAWAALACAAVPAAVGAINLFVLRRPSSPPAIPEDASASIRDRSQENTRPARDPGSPLRSGWDDEILVSILIPARNEEANIEAALEAARASRGVALEVVVMDDGSTDRTAEIVSQVAACDPRVRLERAPALPSGWSGKVHACQRLAESARGTYFLFLDADVRLEQHAAAALVAQARARATPFLSAVPRQEMGSPGELLTVPNINLMLLGYLPMALMRARPDPALGAACGQLILVERSAYFAAGGHAAIRGVIHDAMRLVRRFREAGFRTDLVDGSGLARCRMYRGLDEAWSGFSKNATEGIATPMALPIWTALLGLGHVAPPILVGLAAFGIAPARPSLLAFGLSFGFRIAATLKAGETWWTVPLHPLTVATGLGIQWSALIRALRGQPAGWKGRILPVA